jgi:transposase
MAKREVARRIKMSPNTVKNIIEQKGEMLSGERRKDKISIDLDLLRRLYADCDGFCQRVQEKLQEEEGITVKYSTLTRMIRELGIGKVQKARCDHVPDEPGAEMQHDTSPYCIKVGEGLVKVNASLLHLRYSKRRYLKFYRPFNRFKMKCFFHEALMHWGHAAELCIIDNTNLARLRGTGKNAIMVPEMEAFANQYGFKFCCHEKGHADRKAGVERSFYTVETNFFPGRTFSSFEDLNAQALEWSTVRMERRPQTKAKIIPAQAFEEERPYLVKLLPHLPPPYRDHQRNTDEYGYIAFEGNYYWVPGTRRDDVLILEYGEKLQLYVAKDCVAIYPLPPHGTKNKTFSPPDFPPPRHQPKYRKKSTQQEEQRLRTMDPFVGTYLDFVLPLYHGIGRHRFIRRLFTLSQKMTPELFLKSLERAFTYKIIAIDTIERIAVLYLSLGTKELLPLVEVDQTYRDREAYREGYLTDLPDLSIYELPLEDEDDDG